MTDFVPLFSFTQGGANGLSLDVLDNSELTMFGGIVGDYLEWATQNGSGVEGEFEEFSADGNDDGVVDLADIAIWSLYYGHTLELNNFS